MVKKKISAMIMVLILLLWWCFPVSAEAGTEHTEGYYTYTVTNGDATIISVDKNISGAVTVPQSLGGYPLKAIGNSAFENCAELTAITLPAGVELVANNAFAYCENLRAATLPNSLVTIGINVFLNCTKLKEVSLPSVEQLSNGTFENCVSLEKCRLSPHLKKIGDGAFAYCASLKSLGFYESLQSLGNAAFIGCKSLESINFGYYQRIGDNCFKDCTALQYPDLPLAFVSMGVSAFEGCTALEQVSLDDSFLTAVPQRAFAGCTSLRFVSVPMETEFIGEEAFLGCEQLKIENENSYKIRFGTEYKLITDAEWRYANKNTYKPPADSVNPEQNEDNIDWVNVIFASVIAALLSFSALFCIIVISIKKREHQ